MSITLGCSREPGSQPSEYLGSISARSNTTVTRSTPVLPKLNDKSEVKTSIEELAADGKLLALERLSAQAVEAFPDDPEFQVIHARALLDIGRIASSKRILMPLETDQTHRAEVNFILGIATLSDLQTETDDKRRVDAFVDAVSRLYKVAQWAPKFQDRFSPTTHINQVRQSLTKYGKQLPLDTLTIEQFDSDTSLLAMLDIVKRLGKKELAKKLLENAHKAYPESSSLWLSRAEMHLTQNEPLVALEFINQVKSFDQLSAEELLTYAAGQIAAAKQIKTPGIEPFARSYRALEMAEKLPGDSVFKTLVPRIKKTIFRLLPADSAQRSTGSLNEAEKQALEKLLKDASTSKSP